MVATSETLNRASRLDGWRVVGGSGLTIQMQPVWEEGGLTIRREKTPVGKSLLTRNCSTMSCLAPKCGIWSEHDK